jgi:hypothetical protein
MFDPNHNAHDNYYLARGGMDRTWEGLDPDVIVATWFYDKRAESLEWFASRGHRTLIAGYYDQKPERARDWLEAAANGQGHDRHHVHELVRQVRGSRKVRGIRQRVPLSAAS